MSNAIKFTPQKGHVWLNVTVEEESEQSVVLEFSVSDTGIGIEQNKLQSIFNSFEQATNAYNNNYGGTGLGLAITKKLIELMNGEISVVSEPGFGSSFSVTLKFAKTASVNQVSAYKETKNVSSDLTGLHVLLVEDNEINQKVAVTILRHKGIAVDVACNGRDAIAVLKEGRTFDLILMDLKMPEMNGFEATTFIRQELKLDIPILAMTANVMREERVRSINIGMNDYISKPFDNEVLFEKIKILTAKKK